MTSLADRTITALGNNHDELAALVPGLSAEQLNGPSGSAEWPLHQVLSHLGSGAEISLASLRAAVDGTPPPAQDFNQSVWDRWNAMAADEHAAGFLRADAELVQLLKSLGADQRESVQVELGFLPAPLPLAGVTGMRLNEAALHSWDVRVALDPAAEVSDEAAALLVEHFAGDLSFLLGFVAKADALGRTAAIDLAGSGYAITVTDSVRLSRDEAEFDTTFTGPLGAATRLLSGRLTPQHTPSSVSVTGATGLDDLRRVFPGY